MLFTGRYNKYSRNLPQTPWIIDGERKLESSVEELISEHLMAEFKADSKYPGDLLLCIFFIITKIFFIATQLIQQCNRKRFFFFFSFTHLSQSLYTIMLCEKSYDFGLCSIFYYCKISPQLT